MPQQPPTPNFHFEAKWQDFTLTFQDVAGLETSTLQTNVDLRHGSGPADARLQKLFDNTTSHPIQQAPLTITLMTADSTPIKAWQLPDAFPVKIELADLKDNLILIESVSFACSAIHDLPLA